MAGTEAQQSHSLDRRLRVVFSRYLFVLSLFLVPFSSLKPFSPVLFNSGNVNTVVQLLEDSAGPNDHALGYLLVIIVGILESVAHLSYPIANWTFR